MNTKNRLKKLELEIYNSRSPRYTSKEIQAMPDEQLEALCKEYADKFPNHHAAFTAALQFLTDDELEAYRDENYSALRPEAMEKLRDANKIQN